MPLRCQIPHLKTKERDSEITTLGKLDIDIRDLGPQYQLADADVGQNQLDAMLTSVTITLTR